MKRNIVFIYCNILLGVGTVFANNCDTMQCINTILQVVNNTIPVEISPIEWSGEWYLDEWQQIEYMPQEEIYQTSHIIDHVALVETSPNGQGIIEIEGYSISLDDCNHSVINISNQQVDNPYGSQDGVYGSKLVLLDGKLYVHLRIIGTQDFAVDIYGVGRKQTTGDTGKLTYLCDQWNMLGEAFYDGLSHFHTFTQCLTTDTVIDNIRYVRLQQGGAYKGALREDGDANVYFIPDGSTHEYLLYAFQAQVGDELSNLWYGGTPEWHPQILHTTISEISNTDPRIFTIDIECSYERGFVNHEFLSWIEGVGMTDGPCGADCISLDGCAGDYGQGLLCAYKNGEQIYTSSIGEEYGCNYNHEPTTNIYTYGQVMDENQLPLQDIQIIIRSEDNVSTDTVYSGESGDFSSLIQNVPYPIAPMIVTAVDTGGVYLAQTIIVSDYTYECGVDWNPETDIASSEPLVIVMPNAAESLENNLHQLCPAKFLHNGQVLILRGNRTYTVTGQEEK